MKVPRSLKVGPFVYDVQLVSMIDRYKPEIDGICDENELTIKIEASIPAARFQAVLLHEIIHAVDSFMHIGLSEKQVSMLSNGLYMVLKENGLLAEEDDGRKDGV